MRYFSNSLSACALAIQAVTLPSVLQNLPLGRLDEPVQARFSIPHRHRDLPRPHFHGQVRLLRNQPLQLRRLVFSPVVLGDDHLESLNLPAGRILPRGQARIVFTSVGTLANKFCCSLTTDCPLQLVLHRGIRPPGGLCRDVAVKERGVNVGDLLVRLAL